MPQKIPHHTRSIVLGIPLDHIATRAQLEQRITLLLRERSDGNCTYLTTPNPEILLRAVGDEHLQKVLWSANCSLPDGFGLNVGAAIIGTSRTRRWQGRFVAELVLIEAVKTNQPIALIGGDPGSAERAKAALKIRFPGIHIPIAERGPSLDTYKRGAHTQIGWGNAHEEKILIDKITAARVGVIFVGFGQQKQEYWIDHMKDKLPTVQMLMGCGGVIDLWAGIQRPVPMWIAHIGFEWLWRLYWQPARIMRICRAVIVFPLMCVGMRLRGLCCYRANVVSLVINRHNEALIVHERIFKNRWLLPQGGKHLWESLEHAARRELKEEVRLTNVTMRKTFKRIHKYLWIRTQQKMFGWKGQTQSLVVFDASGEDAPVADGHEIDEYCWVPIEHLRKYIDKEKHDLLDKALQIIA